MGSVVLALTTDLFSLQMRGRVMGVVQAAFAASQILGLPTGLFVAVLAVNVLLFVGIFASALISTLPDPGGRGAFMAVNSSPRQISGSCPRRPHQPR